MFTDHHIKGPLPTALMCFRHGSRPAVISVISQLPVACANRPAAIGSGSSVRSLTMISREGMIDDRYDYY